MSAGASQISSPPPTLFLPSLLRGRVLALFLHRHHRTTADDERPPLDRPVLAPSLKGANDYDRPSLPTQLPEDQPER